MTKFKIQNNTDTVDIDQKSIGLDSWIEGDSVNLLNTNRGLHIQIRHNRDKDTFEAANKLAHLLSNAPKMLEALKTVLRRLDLEEEEKPKQSYILAAYRKDIQKLVNEIEGNK